MFSSCALWLSVVLAVGLPAVSKADTTNKVLKCSDENHLLRLNCDAGTIRVDRAEYGDDYEGHPDLCPSVTTTQNSQCSSSPIVEYLQTQCDNVPACEVPNRSIRQEDACFGDHKYIEVDFTCVDDGPTVVTRTHCIRSYIDLECPTDAFIHILSGEWGRTDASTCGVLGGNGNTNCGSSAKAKLRELCQGKQRCFIGAFKSDFGKPCDIEYMYLTFRYSCVRELTVCQDETAHLQCPDGKKIVITAAEFGRRDTTTCSDVCNTEVNDTKCSGQTLTTFAMKKLCNGKEECYVEAKPTTPNFPDNCPNIYKYLRVAWLCGGP